MSEQRRKDVISSIFGPDMRRKCYVEIPFSRYEETFIRRPQRGRFQRPGDVNFDLKSTSNRRLQKTFFRRLFDVSVLVGLDIQFNRPNLTKAQNTGSAFRLLWYTFTVTKQYESIDVRQIPLTFFIFHLACSHGTQLFLYSLGLPNWDRSKLTSPPLK